MRRLVDRALARIGLPAALITATILIGSGGPALGQSLTLDFGGEQVGSTTARIIQLVALLTIISIAPGILVMVTSFTRIVIVLSFLRSALATQQAPPNMVMLTLALFLTGFIMAPTFQAAYDNGVVPLMNEEIDEFEALELAAKPFHQFMMRQVREQDLNLFAGIAQTTAEQIGEQTPYRVLIPAFMISELHRAFEIGFLLYLPFLIIDMVIASVLMSMGMMMLPPVIISLPFKLIFFVLVDGWYLIAGSLVQSFGPG